jgi:hemerythrin
MDMLVSLPARAIGARYEAPATQCAGVAEYRRQMFALITAFRQAVARPRSRKEAIRLLKEILPCLDAYFSAVESLIDKISPAGAAPHRDEHRRILDELKSTLKRCSASGAEYATADLVHALDALVIREATLCLRACEDRFSPR